MNDKACAVVALAISLCACGKQNQAPVDSAPVKVERQFLQGVPADAPYVAAAMAPAPLERILPWLRTLDDAAMPAPERVAELLADPELRPRKRRALAVLAELTGHFTPAGLRELGFSPQPRAVLYGIGLLPALRLEIEDPIRVRAFLDRVGARAGIEATAKRESDVEYWSFPAVRPDRQIVVAVRGQVLLLGLATPQTERTFVRHLLGTAPVLESMPDDQLRTIAKTWGLQDYSVGFVDLARLAQIVVDPQPGLNAEIWSTLKKPGRQISNACRDETLALAARAPRFVFGSESWSSSSLSFSAGLELRDDFSASLAAAKTGAPLLKAAQAAGIAGIAGFGFDLGKVVELLRTRARAVNEQPFQCEWYSSLNAGAKALASRWSILPPVLAQVRGGTLLVRDLRPTAEFEQDPRQSNLHVDAIAALSTESPVELFDFLKSFHAGTFELALDPAGQALALPSIGSLQKLQSPRIFTRPGTLALTSGAWRPQALSAEELGAAPAPFLFLSYDAEKIAERLEFDDSAAFRHALRGTAALQIEPTARGLHFRSTYNREAAE